MRLCLAKLQPPIFLSRVADPHHFNANPDPDPAFPFNADPVPDPAFLFDTDPNLAPLQSDPMTGL